MRILTFILVCLIMTYTHAEPRAVQKTVICADKIAVFEQLIKDFGETPQWTGVSPTENTQVILTVNLKTGAWTSRVQGQLGLYTGSGRRFKQSLGHTGINTLL